MARDTCSPQIIRKTVAAAARSSPVGVVPLWLTSRVATGTLGLLSACSPIVLLIVIASRCR